MFPYVRPRLLTVRHVFSSITLSAISGRVLRLDAGRAFLEATLYRIGGIVNPILKWGTARMSNETNSAAVITGVNHTVEHAAMGASAPPRQHTARAQFVAFVRLSRLRFLLESLLLVTSGVTVAVYQGHPLMWSGYLLAQGFAWGTHLMVHYCNEYFDLEADTAQISPTAWTGGSRVLASGLLKPVVSLAAAFVSLFIVLVLVIALPTVEARAIALAAVGLAWFYTAPPARLNYRGLGEITTAAVLNVLWPSLAYYLQARTFPPLLLAIVLPTFLIMTARMMVMNFCDSDADLSVGKRTLPNLLGPRRAAQLFTALQIVAYGLIALFTAIGVLPVVAGVAMLLTALLAGWLAVRLFRDPPNEQDPVRANATAMWATTHIHAISYAATVGLIVAGALPGGHATRIGWALCVGLVVVYSALFTIQRLRAR